MIYQRKFVASYKVVSIYLIYIPQIDLYHTRTCLLIHNIDKELKCGWNCNKLIWGHILKSEGHPHGRYKKFPIIITFAGKNIISRKYWGKRKGDLFYASMVRVWAYCSHLKGTSTVHQSSSDHMKPIMPSSLYCT